MENILYTINMMLKAMAGTCLRVIISTVVKTAVQYSVTDTSNCTNIPLKMKVTAIQNNKGCRNSDPCRELINPLKTKRICFI
jgi:hypothetical protein